MAVKTCSIQQLFTESWTNGALNAQTQQIQRVSGPAVMAPYRACVFLCVCVCVWWGFGGRRASSITDSQQAQTCLIMNPDYN